MKLMMKVLFLALLTSFLVISRPRIARAQGQEWVCSEPGMYNCTDAASSWMGGCVGSCPKQGTESQYEYYYVVNSGGTYYLTEEYYNAPETASGCYETCDNEMNSRIEECLSSNCTQE